MEELVKTGDYAALAAHCEDAELKVSGICWRTSDVIYPIYKSPCVLT